MHPRPRRRRHRLAPGWPSADSCPRRLRPRRCRRPCRRHPPARRDRRWLGRVWRQDAVVTAVEHSVPVVIGVACVTAAVPVRVHLSRVCHGRAVVVLVGHVVAVVVGIASVACAVAVAVLLVGFGASEQLSAVSATPSLSSSASALLPMPSPSVSACSAGSSGNASSAFALPSPSRSGSHGSPTSSASASCCSAFEIAGSCPRHSRRRRRRGRSRRGPRCRHRRRRLDRGLPEPGQLSALSTAPSLSRSSSWVSSPSPSSSTSGSMSALIVSSKFS